MKSGEKKNCVEKAACFLTETASGECVTLSVVNKPGIYWLDGRPMLVPRCRLQYPPTLCAYLAYMHTKGVLQPHPSCSFSLPSEGWVRNHPSHLAAHPVKTRWQCFTWICPEAQKGGLDPASFLRTVLEVMGCKSLNGSFSVCPGFELALRFLTQQ